MVIDGFNKTIDVWIDALSDYDFITLCFKPSPQHWSLGQVYMHLIENTDYFIEQARICAAGNDNASEASSRDAKAMFSANSFPNEQLEGPPENALTPQPESKGQLANDLIRIKSDAAALYAIMAASEYKGKTKHPGLNYFSASEWVQFAEMHLRHHLRQKERIDAFLRRLRSTVT
jgi:hypothetical protein